jgi:general secretion pathway protein H
MPTLAIGISVSSSLRIARSQFGQRGAGFTLIEIMVVVFIIGLVAAAAVIKFGGDRRDTALDKEAQRLDALFDYVREQAELQTRDYGFRVDAESYSFVVFDVLRNEWRQADEDDALREREFPDGVLPTVVVEGRTIVLDRKKPSVPDFKPQVMIFANGDLSSFEVWLQREGGSDRAHIYTDEQSNIRLLLPGETEQKGPPVRAAAVR